MSRADSWTDEMKATAKIVGAKGGKTRAERLTPQQRSDSARYAAMIRWNGKA